MTGHGSTESSGLTVDQPQPHSRWHDLDALRAFAMLLGIALHASLSFFPWVWPVQDDTSSIEGPFDEFFHAVHGFRMPLFFLLSGFFTALLWRRKGLTNLLGQRIKRIALPLAIGMVTIVPAVTWSVGWAVDNGVSDYVEEHSDVWAAVFFGNADAVEVLLDGGVGVNAPNETDEGNTPLHIAAYTNDVEIAQLLLDRGADPMAMAVGGTPIDFAVFMGNEAVADVLLNSGAPDPRSPGGAWTELDFWAMGASEAIESADVLGLQSWLNSLYHLWFLWFLLWLIAGFTVVALVADRFGSHGAGPATWTGIIMWALIPAALIPQLFMGDNGSIPVFGPDTSTGLLPTPHVLAYYGVFFTFGALLYGRKNRAGGQLVESIGKWWIALLPVGLLVVFPLAMRLTFEWEGATWLQASVAQVAYAWLVIFGLMGLFRFFLAKERPGVRYLSDSSYWLYLIHLPMVIVAQSWIRHWDLPAWLKFAGLTMAITLVALLTYQLFVRYTPIGTLLNGKRTRPSPMQPAHDELSRTGRRRTSGAASE